MAVLECCLVFPLIAWTAFAQQGKQEAPPPYVPQDHRPGLFFREDFKAPPPGLHIAPMTQEFIASPNLELRLYGAGKALQIDNSPLPKDDPDFVWTGLAESNWGLALRDKSNYVDLTGLAKVRWRTAKVSEAPTGTHYQNGIWEEHPDLSKVDEIGFTDLMAGSGRGEGGWCRIDWFEVYGNAVKRDTSATQ